MNNFSFHFQNIGKNLNTIRENCGKTVKQCAGIIGVSPGKYKKYEIGELIPTLPELEALSFFLDTPLYKIASHPDLVGSGCIIPENDSLLALIEIRRNLIGTLIKIEREKKKISLNELSKRTGISTSRIKKYENSLLGIPMDDLNAIAHALDINWEALIDQSSPVGLWQQEQTRIHNFLELPIETQEFLSDTSNHAYFKLVEQWKTIDKDDWQKMYESFQMILSQMPQEPEDQERKTIE